MIKRNKKSPLRAEMEAVLKKEQAFLKKNAEKKASFLDRTLEEKVPARLQGTEICFWPVWKGWDSVSWESVFRISRFLRG